ATRALAIARNRLGYARLTADEAGVVIALPAEAGQVVAVGQPVARIARLGEREAVVAIPEHKLDLARAAAARVALWADGSRTYPAVLREIAPQADGATRTFEARFSIPDADDAVSLGMSARVILTPDPTSRVVRLPAAAVISQGRDAMVWVLDPAAGTVARARVEVAAFGQRETLISAGLSSGDLVVTLGAHLLDDGQRVRVVERGVETAGDVR
ncbi:MAG TPA: efflux RND transporter periplasmic adaptor subunit, partial [Azospirillum sp.]